MGSFGKFHSHRTGPSRCLPVILSPLREDAYTDHLRIHIQGAGRAMVITGNTAVTVAVKPIQDIFAILGNINSHVHLLPL